jgi:hypothetical protein
VTSTSFDTSSIIPGTVTTDGRRFILSHTKVSSYIFEQINF